MTRNDIICWLDLETTGSDPRSAVIEVGMAITDATPDLLVLREFTRTSRPAYWNAIHRPKMDPIVVEMHTKNGLLDEIESLESPPYATDQYLELEQAMLDFLGPGTNRIPLAGSGVCHFDRQFIRRDFPRVDSRFTYWTYDVGVVRRMLRLAGAADVIPASADGKNHRALDDVHGDIEQARRYLAFMQERVPA